MNRTIDSRLRKPLSNCLSSKVTFNVCSKLLWVKYKFFFAQNMYEKNSIIIFCSFQHDLLSFASNTESIKNILYTSLQVSILCFKDNMLNYHIFIGMKHSESEILFRYIYIYIYIYSHYTNNPVFSFCYGDLFIFDMTCLNLFHVRNLKSLSREAYVKS